MDKEVKQEIQQCIDAWKEAYSRKWKSNLDPVRSCLEFETDLFVLRGAMFITSDWLDMTGTLFQRAAERHIEIMRERLKREKDESIKAWLLAFLDMDKKRRTLIQSGVSHAE